MPTIEDIIEELAALEHEQWVVWSKQLAEEELLSEDRMRKWEESWCPYFMLGEEKKELDRKWARRVLEILLKYFVSLGRKGEEKKI